MIDLNTFSSNQKPRCSNRLPVTSDCTQTDLQLDLTPERRGISQKLTWMYRGFRKNPHGNRPLAMANAEHLTTAAEGIDSGHTSHLYQGAPVGLTALNKIWNITNSVRSTVDARFGRREAADWAAPPTAAKSDSYWARLVRVGGRFDQLQRKDGYQFSGSFKCSHAAPVLVLRIGARYTSKCIIKSWMQRCCIKIPIQIKIPINIFCD